MSCRERLECDAWTNSAGVVGDRRPILAWDSASTFPRPDPKRTGSIIWKRDASGQRGSASKLFNDLSDLIHSRYDTVSIGLVKTPCIE